MAERKTPKKKVPLKDLGVGSVNRTKRERKTEKCLDSAHYLLLINKGGFEDYVRAHRILYDCDPDTEDVPSEFPFADYM